MIVWVFDIWTVEFQVAMKPSHVLVPTLLSPSAESHIFSQGCNPWQTKHDCRQEFLLGVYCSECEDCPGNGVIVGMPPCCDLYMSNLPPIEGQSWPLIVWNGTLLVFHKCQGQSNYPTRSQSHLLESWTFHCPDCQHPPPYGGVTRRCDVMTGRCSLSRNTWRDWQSWNKHRSPLNMLLWIKLPGKPPEKSEEATGTNSPYWRETKRWAWTLKDSESDVLLVPDIPDIHEIGHII